MKILNLDKCEDLFKDSESANKFGQILLDCIENDLSLVISKDKIIGSLLSEESSKDFLYRRLMKNIIHSPELLDKLTLNQ